MLVPETPWAACSWQSSWHGSWHPRTRFNSRCIIGNSVMCTASLISLSLGFLFSEAEAPTLGISVRIQWSVITGNAPRPRQELLWSVKWGYCIHVEEDTVSSCLIYIEPHGYLLENTEGKKKSKTGCAQWHRTIYIEESMHTSQTTSCGFHGYVWIWNLSWPHPREWVHIWGVLASN